MPVYNIQCISPKYWRQLQHKGLKQKLLGRLTLAALNDSIPLKYNPLSNPSCDFPSNQPSPANHTALCPKCTQLKNVLAPAGETLLALTCALDEAEGAAADVWWRWCPTPGCYGCFWANPQGVMMDMGCCGSHGRTRSLQWETRLSSPSPQQ